MSIHTLRIVGALCAAFGLALAIESALGHDPVCPKNAISAAKKACKSAEAGTNLYTCDSFKNETDCKDFAIFHAIHVELFPDGCLDNSPNMTKCDSPLGDCSTVATCSWHPEIGTGVCKELTLGNVWSQVAKPETNPCP